MAKNLYEKLLLEFANAIVKMQDKSHMKAFRGGVKCEACKNIHGRCIDSIYGLLVAYKLTKNKKFLESLELLFDYGENLICKDGGIYNDAQTEWRYTTTFQEISLIETITSGKKILSKKLIKKIDHRIKICADWLYKNLNEFSYTNINYTATNGLALTMAGNYLKNKKYKDQGKHLIEYALKHLSKNNILYGETKPHNAQSKKKCFAIDLGYNLEESIPAIVKYAFIENDKQIISQIEKVVNQNLNFILPDGGIDNSFGNRNNKWTYWGSRTSDGIHAGFLHFADKDIRYAEASLRNVEQLNACTINGILYGGPRYYKHHEYGCTHHLVEHINSLAYCIEHFSPKLLERKYFGNISLPLDSDFFEYLEEVRTLRVKKGKYFATITDYDYDTQGSGHASGLTLTCLFKEKNIPMVMGSVTDYKLVEPTNMQVALDRDSHRSLLPRLELIKNNKRYTSTYYDNASFIYTNNKGQTHIRGTTGLENEQKEIIKKNINIEYIISKKGVEIHIYNLQNENFIVPLINGNAEILSGKLTATKEIFFLTGGFMAKEHTIQPNKKGEINILLF